MPERMPDYKLAAERIHVLDGDQIDGLRHSYPELSFVFDELDKLRALNGEMLDAINLLEAGNG